MAAKLTDLKKCPILFYDWTPWENSYELDKDGNDYEFLENHK